MSETPDHTEPEITPAPETPTEDTGKKNKKKHAQKGKSFEKKSADASPDMPETEGESTPATETEPPTQSTEIPPEVTRSVPEIAPEIGKVISDTREKLGLWKRLTKGIKDFWTNLWGKDQPASNVRELKPIEPPEIKDKVA